jgi:uncharacterized membrane protein
MGIIMNNTRNTLIILFVFFIFYTTILLPLAKAEDYYADININVDSSGFVTIGGITNHPDLIVENTPIYTLKKQSYWLLNITKDEVFSNYIYVLTLPKGSSINYVTSSDSFRIEESLGNLVVRGYGENKSFSLVVQYEIKKISEEDTVSFDKNILLILEIVIVALIILLVFSIFQNKRKKMVISDEKLDNKAEYNFRGLSDRQKQIMQFLIDQKRPVTQAEIQKELNIPKAAVSRNVHTLEIKNLVEIEKIGMSNLIRLKKQ